MTAMSDPTPSAATESGLTAFFPVNLTQALAPSPCLVLSAAETGGGGGGGAAAAVAPWNNPDNLVSAGTEALFRTLANSVVLPLTFLIGAPANVINMAVFYKQGLKERINVCLFSLSLADFLYLVLVMVLCAEQTLAHLASGFTAGYRAGPVYRFLLNHNLIGFYGFTWVSQIIAAVIASERCFCILAPLRSQTVLSPSTTTLLMVLVNGLTVGFYSLVVSRYRVVCVYDPLTASGKLTPLPSPFYRQHQQLVDFFDGYVFGVAIPVLTMVVVMVTTMVTMVKLRQAAAWRASASSAGGGGGGGSGGGSGGSGGGSGGGNSMSSRDMAVTLMLVYTSIFFVICVFPLALFRVTWLFVGDLNLGKPQHNLFLMCKWIQISTTYVNASFNIFVYYTAGSRYRQTFWRLLGREKRTRAVKDAAAAAAAAADRKKTVFGQQ